MPWLLTILLLLAAPAAAQAQTGTEVHYVETLAAPGSFPLVSRGVAAPLYADSGDWPGVLRAVADLRADIGRVTGVTPQTLTDSARFSSPQAVIIGTVGRSRVIQRLAADGRIDVTPIAGKWESFFLETVSNPMPGVGSALVIAGSDKRGTIYGIYDLSRQIGVSPWYWWADVAPDRKSALFIKPGRYEQGEPSVKYRGIFLNDEKPDLDYWVRKTYGEHPVPGGTAANFNHEFYARIFEVILRLKGNYLWPAMWNNAFAQDDPENPRLADEYGIVMGSSHQEPMLRAQKEWDWNLRAKYGRWNYAAHPGVLENFWREGIRQRKNFESVVTIGLRGEDDTAMVEGQAASMALLEKIVEVQRKILAAEVNPDVTAVPQLWCLYKEVQDYYHAGLRVPDDVTLLWAEDNWGNVRRLPTAAERTRSGGAGIYYHFDYHGGPRSYQWINTSPIAKIWDQMTLAKQYGADRIWIVNVGHFKGYELPTEFFLDLAWKTDRWGPESMTEYVRSWASRQFGPRLAADAADVLVKYTKYNGRRKPELLEPGTYSVTNYGEAERISADFAAIVAKAERIYAALPPHKRDAFYELALFPAKASAHVNDLYIAAAKNALYAAQGRASTNDMAAQARALFRADGDLMTQFNKVLAGGKWDHFMDQPHIGYTSWRDPPENNMDAIHLKEIDVPAGAAMGVAVDGSIGAWPGAPGEPELPAFDALNDQRSYIEVFNRGRAPFRCTASANVPWIVLGQKACTVDKDTRLSVSVNWSAAPAGPSAGVVTISGAGSTVAVKVNAFKAAGVTRASLRGFAEGQGYVSIEAEHFTNKRDAGVNRWIRIEDYGRTLSGMRATSTPDTPSATPGTDSPVLEYSMYLFTPGAVTASLTVGPTLNFVAGRGLRVAVSFDNDPPQTLTLVPADYNAQNGNRDWEETVRNEARVVTSSHAIAKAGYHTFKIWMVDPAVIVEKIVVNTPASKNAPSYLGPPESYYGRASAAISSFIANFGSTTSNTLNALTK